MGAAGGQAAVGGAGGVAAGDLAEDQHPGGASEFLHQGLDLRIVDPAHLVRIVEVAHRRRPALEDEAIAFKRQPVRDPAHIVDAHIVVLHRPVGAFAVGGIEARGLAGLHIGQGDIDMGRPLGEPRQRALHDVDRAHAVLPQFIRC